VLTAKSLSEIQFQTQIREQREESLRRMKERLPTAREMIEPIMKKNPSPARIRTVVEENHFRKHGPEEPPPWWSIPAFRKLEPYMQVAFLCKGQVNRDTPIGRAMRHAHDFAFYLLQQAVRDGQEARYSIPIGSDLLEQRQRLQETRQREEADAGRRYERERQEDEELGVDEPPDFGDDDVSYDGNDYSELYHGDGAIETVYGEVVDDAEL
jgi:hypothetical protein